MSWEGYSWLLLRAVEIVAHQLMALLKTCDNGNPSTEQEIKAITTMLRREGHI